MKERRVRCPSCGDRFTVMRIERERTSVYCDLCRAERRREQTRERMRALRARTRQTGGDDPTSGDTPPRY